MLTDHELRQRTKSGMGAGRDPFAGLTDKEQDALCRLAVTEGGRFEVHVASHAYAPIDRRYCRIPTLRMTELGLKPSREDAIAQIKSIMYRHDLTLEDLDLASA